MTGAGIPRNFLVFIVLFLVYVCAVQSCIDSEREALLRVKQSLTDEHGLLWSWGSEDHQKECCKWNYIECSNTTGHVTSLYLFSNYPYKFGGKISSALLELHHLNYLDLSGNDFGGIRIPEFIASIKTLQHLYLRYSNFSGSIPPQLGNLTNLHTLYLSDNIFQGGIPPQLGNLTNLQALYLYGNMLQGGIPPQLGNLTNLQDLYLSGNMLQGGIPKSWGNLSHLQYLDLSGNDLGEPLAELLGKLSCRQLVLLDLSNTQLTGSVSAASLAQLSNLEYLYLFYNSITLELSPDWIPPFHLEQIYLARCKMGPSFPAWLQTQSNLTHLDISDNDISDEVPKWFWNFSPRLDMLNISHNQISGTIPDLSSIPIRLIDVSSNKFSGPLPLLHSNISFVQLSQNQFSGYLSSICSIYFNYLQLLDLANNHLEGSLPNCWENMTELIVLNLNHNNFSGEIPHSLGSLWKLETLHLRGNSLSEKLPSTLKNIQFLQSIDIGGNKLTGHIPSWLGNNTNMAYLSIRQNRFYGGIPPEICKLSLMQMLDLSGNNLSGKIPQCFNNFTSLADKNTTTKITIRIVIAYNDYVDYALVQWKGQESEYKSTLGLLKLIDLSSNRLVGSIPKAFSSLRGLISLNLSRNSLTGNIDPDIGKMEMLECLDLSRNQLLGEIPIGLAKLYKLAVLHLENNNLSGKIPLGAQLQTFDESDFAGNVQLCGKPLKLCPEDELKPTKEGEDIKEKDEGFFTQSLKEEFGISMGFGFIVGFWGMVGSLLLMKSWRSAYFNFFDVVGDWLYVTITIFLNKFRRS